MSMKLLLLIIALLLPAMAARAKATITIAVIDTGFGYQDMGHSAHLCKFGHKDFTSDQNFSGAYPTKSPIPVDTMGHGTNIVGVIQEQLEQTKRPYCFVILKAYNSYTYNSSRTVERAIAYATYIQADYINFSAGGSDADPYEGWLVSQYLRQGGVMIAAAGNANADLGAGATYYPAMYPGVISVGNVQEDGTRESHSNYGKPVSRWEMGTHKRAYGVTQTGTSQAAAVATGKIVAQRLK
jgi:serine protease